MTALVVKGAGRYGWRLLSWNSVPANVIGVSGIDVRDTGVE
jgi:hypothetical protein